MGALEKIIRPIVEGQIRGFVKEHPSVLDGVDWYKPRLDKKTSFVNSLAKRIVRDLCCEQTMARLTVALLEHGPEMPPKAGDGFLTVAGKDAVELRPAASDSDRGTVSAV